MERVIRLLFLSKRPACRGWERKRRQSPGMKKRLGGGGAGWEGNKKKEQWKKEK